MCFCVLFGTLVYISICLINNISSIYIIAIIKEILKSKELSDELIETALLQAIYSVDNNGNICTLKNVNELKEKPVSQHIATGNYFFLKKNDNYKFNFLFWKKTKKAFTTRQHNIKILPTAVLLASGLCNSVSEAQNMLQNEILRKLVVKAQQTTAD